MRAFRFEADPKIAALAVEAAAEWVATARTYFRVELDYSDASIEQIERQAVRICGERPARPADPSTVRRQLRSFANDIGCYIGEAFRRNHGATWGWVSEGGGSRMDGLETDSGNLFWPTAQARRRLEGASDESLWAYYLALVAHEAQLAAIPADERTGTTGTRIRVLRVPHERGTGDDA